MSRDRLPLEPGPPARLLGWVHGSDTPRTRAIPRPARFALGVLITIALGTWGFLQLHTSPRQSFLESLYAAVKLFTLDMGPANGSSPGPNWQIGLALLLAALLVLRGVLGLLRERIRRGAVRHLVRGHVVICGAGLHAARLAAELGDRHDVVVVDLDPTAPGMSEPRRAHEWRLTGDAVSEATLLDAGIARAHWLIAITGADFVNSQIVSTARSLAAAGRLPDRAHLLVQIEDPVLSRFLETTPEPPEPGTPEPYVTPFSTNAIAADRLLEEAAVPAAGGTAPLLAMRDGRAPNLLLGGDHPLLDALVLAALHRWRVRTLRDREAGRQVTRPPLHISVFGPGAEARVARLRRRWRPEPSVLALEARDSPAAGAVSAEAEEWLRLPGRADHAIVAAAGELDGIALTLGFARALGGGATMTRVTTQFENALDAHVERQTAASGELATTEVRSLADLGSRPDAMRRLPGVERLAATLAHEEPRSARARAGALFDREELELRTEPNWRIRESERPLVRVLLELPPPLAPIPVSALVRSNLRITLDAPENLHAAATRLTAQGDPVGFAAWCEYVRALPPGPPPGGLPPEDRAVRALVALRTALGGTASALEAFTPDGSLLRDAGEVVILAGGAASLSPATAAVLAPLLERALAGFEGTVLCGGTASGLPGIVARAARANGVRLIGYAPSGRADRELYPLVRETADSAEFTVLEPLAMWTEILRAGRSPRDVRLLACPGGAITIAEMLLARALGAETAFLDPSGDVPLDDLLPFGRTGVLDLPSDAMTVRAFLTRSELEEPLRTQIARHLHDAYRRSQRGRKPPDDPALAPWAELAPTLQASNLALADSIPGKLALVGRHLERGGAPLRLSTAEVERLAEIEHGRWNAERLAAGWRSGVREVEHTTTPDLRPWSELSDAVREYDRDAVRSIAGALADSGWGVTDDTGQQG